MLWMRCGHSFFHAPLSWGVVGDERVVFFAFILFLSFLLPSFFFLFFFSLSLSLSSCLLLALLSPNFFPFSKFLPAFLFSLFASFFFSDLFSFFFLLFFSLIFSFFLSFFLFMFFSFFFLLSLTEQVAAADGGQTLQHCLTTPKHPIGSNAGPSPGSCAERLESYF